MFGGLGGGSTWGAPAPGDTGTGGQALWGDAKAPGLGGLGQDDSPAEEPPFVGGAADDMMAAIAGEAALGALGGEDDETFGGNQPPRAPAPCRSPRACNPSPSACLSQVRQAARLSHAPGFCG